MTMYIIAGLAGVAAWFYALYQRSQRQRAEVALSTCQKSLVQAQADSVAQNARYEALVTGLKGQLKLLEDSFDATATPDAVRARFRELFPRPGQALGAPVVPAGAASPAPAGPVVRVP